jgi:hypothetical protein
VETNLMKPPAPLAYAHSQQADKMPHERDETVDPVVPPPEPEMKQASIDVTRGMVDTDRGAAMNVTYKKQKKRGA